MSDILNIIQTRRSTRVPFDNSHPIANEDLRQILDAGRWAPTAHNMQNFEVVVVDDPKLLAAIGNIPRSTSAVFIRENYQQLSFSEEELLRKKVGLLGTMFPPSWRNPDAKPEITSESEEASRPIPASPVLLLHYTIPTGERPARKAISWASSAWGA